MSKFEGLLSLADAASMWHLEESTIRKAISRGKLVEGVDAKKFGKQWIVTESSMEREYGVLEFFEGEQLEKDYQKRMQIYYFFSQCLLQYSKKHKASTTEVAELFKEYKIWDYIGSCYDYLHLSPISEVVNDISARIRRGVYFEKR